jgi:2-C-methyl-D-erythritol 4-phosphate cytidylyltransferase
MFDFSAVIVAGGSGTRMKHSTRKALIEIAGAPLVVHAARAFSELSGVAEVIVVLPASELASLAQGATDVMAADLPHDAPAPIPQLRSAGVSRLVAGGARRQDSVLNGLRACDAEVPYVMIHDAARPFVTRDELMALMARARQSGAAILAHPVRDTLKQVAGDVIEGTVDRSCLWSAQTPQAFRRQPLMQAFERHSSRDVTDDAAMAALGGLTCVVVPGSAANFKITTPEDLELAEALLALRAARSGDLQGASAVFRKIQSGETVVDLDPGTDQGAA